MSTGNIEFQVDHKEKEWKVTLVNTGLNTLKGGRIEKNKKYLESNINMLTYGDGVADIDINA